MKACVFLDAFAECLVNVGMGRKYPSLHRALRAISIAQVVGRHGDAHTDATGRMFDRLWNDMQNHGAPK